MMVPGLKGVDRSCGMMEESGESGLFVENVCFIWRAKACTYTQKDQNVKA